jgi:hypothetical protein
MGPQGEQGPEGPPGETGNGIESIRKIGSIGDSDVYLITFTSGGSSTFSVKNGANGTDGYSPVARVSKSGKVATITITDKNGTTTASISDGVGAIDSVNGKTGTVILNAEDVGALPSSTIIPTKTSDLTNDRGFVDTAGAASAAPVQSVNGQTGIVSLVASDIGAGTYSKPSGGIPSSDMSTEV